MSLNILYIFEFDLKHMLTLLFLIKTHFIDIIYIAFINFRINVLMCCIFHTEFFVILQDDFINCMLDYIIFILLYSKFILSCRFLQYLVGLVLEDLEPKSTNILHSSDECPGPWMRHVSLYLPFG